MRQVCACKTVRWILTVIAKRYNKFTWLIKKQKSKIKLEQFDVQRAQREHKIGTKKIVKKKIANTLAYADLALEKFIGIDASEDPTALIRLLEKKISFSSVSRPATNDNDEQTAYDDQRKVVFGSVLRRPLLSGSIHLKLL